MYAYTHIKQANVKSYSDLANPGHQIAVKTCINVWPKRPSGQ